MIEHYAKAFAPNTSQSTTATFLNSFPRVSDSFTPKYFSDSRLQPLIGVIDTAFSISDLDIDRSQIILGDDRHTEPQKNRYFVPHGNHILHTIRAAQRCVDIADLSSTRFWLSRGVGTGQWANALIEFVDTARTLGHPLAIANLSFDLIQAQPNGGIATRYALTSEEYQALAYAHRHGVLIVMAAGNHGGKISALGQASTIFDNMITVGAATGLQRVPYSSYGNGLTLLADGDSGDFQGTSVAAARVTGVASQVWAANPELAYQQVIHSLISTTHSHTSQWHPETGYGLLNPAIALWMAQSMEPQPEHSPEPVTPPTLITPTDVEAVFLLERPLGLWDAISDVWDGAKGAWKGVKKGATWVYKQTNDKIVDSFERYVDWGKKLPSKFGDLENNSLGFITAVGKGDFVKAAGAFGRMVINFHEIAAVPQQLEQLADWLKFNARGLTKAEIDIAKSVFGDSINYSLVRLDEVSLFILALSKTPLRGNQPFTSFNTINSLGKMAPDVFIHEMAHVWQYQHNGAVYAADALSAQIEKGQGAYDYGGVSALVGAIASGKSFHSFNAEEQAQIVQDYYLLRTDGNPNNDIYLSTYTQFVKEVSTLPVDKLAMMPTDSGNTLKDAREITVGQLNVLNNNIFLRESLSDKDTVDVLKLPIKGGQNLSVSLTGLSGDADLRIIQDLNTNGRVDNGEVLGISSLTGTQSESINLLGLPSGNNYFVEVKRFEGKPNYNLSVNIATVADDSDNTITGDDAKNFFDGFGGNDVIYGLGGHDMLRGGDGEDYIDGWEGNDDLIGGQGNDILVAWSGNDTVAGDDGDDWLDGSFDNDLLIGGTGNDTLGNPVEPEPGNDIMFGDEGDDLIYGGDGADRLAGGDGQDHLVGGEGTDTFLMAKLSDGVDAIVGFEADTDIIWISRSGFGNDLTSNAFLADNQLAIGSAATTPNHRVIYDLGTGNLFFDTDGVGGAPQVKLASLRDELALNNFNFFVIG